MLNTWEMKSIAKTNREIHKLVDRVFLNLCATDKETLRIFQTLINSIWVPPVVAVEGALPVLAVVVTHAVAVDYVFVMATLGSPRWTFSFSHEILQRG